VVELQEKHLTCKNAAPESSKDNPWCFVANPGTYGKYPLKQLRVFVDRILSVMCALLFCASGKEKMSVSKSDALNVSAIATACEESYKTGLPVQLSLSDDGLGSADMKQCIANGDAVTDAVMKSHVIAQ